MTESRDAELALVRRWLKAGGPEDVARAVETLKDAAQAGGGEAACLLAVLAGMGVGMPQSWTVALDHLLRAAQTGSAPAQGQLRALASDEAAADQRAYSVDWATLARATRVEAWTAPCDKQVLSKAPRVVAIEGFLSPRVCGWIISRAAGRVSPARVYDAAQASGRLDPSRSNSAFEFELADLDLVLLMARARIAATIGVPVGALEPPQVLHYETGQGFARHHDYLDPEKPAQAADIAARGQRIVTFLVYLSAGFEGGETDFPLIGLRRRGGAGDALYFGNIDPAGTPDPRTLHAGLPPTAGEKWILSQWIRDRARI